MFLTSQMLSCQFIKALDHQSFLLIQTNLNLKVLPIAHFTQVLPIADFTQVLPNAHFTQILPIVHVTQILHFRSKSNSEILLIGLLVQILLQNLILN